MKCKKNCHQLFCNVPPQWWKKASFQFFLGLEWLIQQKRRNKKNEKCEKCVGCINEIHFKRHEMKKKWKQNKDDKKGCWEKISRAIAYNDLI